MTQDRKTYLAWLNNAYAQELAMARMYRMHAKDATRKLNRFPELSDHLHKHADVCLENAEKVKGCLTRNQAKPNPAKITLGAVMGAGLGFTGDVTIDKVIMNDLTDLGMANFEIGAYLTIEAAAKTMKDPETAKAAQNILKEKRQFAAWLELQVQPVATTFLKRTVEN